MNVKRLLVASLILVTIITGLQPVKAAVLQFGPYSGVSPDSGTCGNDWANDDITRTLVVDTANPNHPTIKWAGFWTSVAGKSPGACNTAPYNGKVIQAGVTGTLVGDYDLQINGGSFNPAAVCTASSCNTTLGLVKTFYGQGATYNPAPGYFYFRYDTCDGRWWQNASANKGGNQGDIFGGPAVCAQFWNPQDGRVEPRPGDRIAVYCNTPDPDRLMVYGIADDVPGPRNGFFLVVFSRKAILAAGDKGLTLTAGANGTISASLMKGWFWIAWNGGKYRATGQGDFKKNFEAAAWCPLGK